MTKIEKLREWNAETAIILGSGLNSLVSESNNDRTISYSEFAEIPPPTVQGHLGRFVLGNIGKARVIFAQGRLHLYEGRSAREVASIVAVLAGAGIEQLIVTNAAGALDPKFKPGEWMMLSDQINLTGTSPLLGSTQFQDMTEVYSSRLREDFRRAAKKIGMKLHEGVYAGVTGPQYETPAEVRTLQTLGAGAVGMSTVLEVIQARALGLEVAAFSCLTNLAAGISKEKLSHDEVLEIGSRASADFSRLLSANLASR